MKKSPTILLIAAGALSLNPINTHAADAPYPLQAFPTQVAPTAMQGKQKILHQDDFSTAPLPKHWGTREKQTVITDGVLNVFRTTEGGGKYKISVQPFKNAEFNFRFKLNGARGFWFGTDDLTITDTVHGGHLFNCAINSEDDTLTFMDSLSGKYNPKHYPRFKKHKDDQKAGKGKKLPADLQTILDNTTKIVPCPLEQKRWYQIKITLKNDTLAVAIDGKKFGSFKSPGFAHPRKDMYRFIMQGPIDLDDMKAIALD